MQNVGSRNSGSSSPKATGPNWRLFVLLLGYTGLRWGEATALRVCDIDLNRRRIDVRRAFSNVGGRVVLGTPKSHQSRTVPIPRFLATELKAAVDGKRADDLVFTVPGGSVMRLSNWRRSVFLPARSRAGMSVRFRIHDLRRTAASLMKTARVASGASFGSFGERATCGAAYRHRSGEQSRAGSEGGVTCDVITLVASDATMRHPERWHRTTA